jgi:hypothetical protein
VGLAPARTGVAQNVYGAGRKEVVGMTEQEAAMIDYYNALKGKPGIESSPPTAPKISAHLPKRRLKELADFVSRYKRPERCAMEEHLATASMRPSQPTMGTIMTDLSQKYGVTEEGIKSKCRVTWVTRIRQEFYYLAAKDTKQGYAAIGRFCGGRDHSTVYYGIAQHCKRNGISTPRELNSYLIERKAAQVRRYRANIAELQAQMGALA